MMKTKFEIKKIGGGHEVTCYQRGMIKRNKYTPKRPAWVKKDSKEFYSDNSRYRAREYGRDFVRECE